MKALRYLLIAVAILSMVSVRAQENTTEWGRLPEAQMQSTSVMQGSGSTLPMAATGGVTTTQSSSPAKVGPRRGFGGGGGGESGEPEDRPEPYADPLGDATLSLAMLACAYIAYRVIRNRRQKIG